MADRIWTIGHSTMSFQEFVDTLQTSNITTLVDVRSMPGSNKFPHFNKENLEEQLPFWNIRYVHLAAIGGRRHNHAADRSINAGWVNESFHSYADYTLTEQFENGLSRLQSIAADWSERVAIMCAEAVPWRCHRSIISDNLAARGWEVQHIIGRVVQRHVLDGWGATPRVDGTWVTYPAPVLEEVSNAQI